MPEFAPHEIGVAGGVLAISAMPGRTRHYGADWQRLMAWRPDLVITMVQIHELARKGAGSLGHDLANAGVSWLHLPLPDYGAPDAAFDADWPKVETQVLGRLRGGGRILVHCYGGCGRSGMVMLRLMLAAGVPDALASLRHLRPCAIETEAQMAWAMQGIHPPERPA